jgi:hypothetical protein
MTFRSIGGQIRNPHVCISLLHSFYTSGNAKWFGCCARMHAWGYVKNRKKRLGAVKVFIVNSFVRAQNILASSLMNNHGVPMGNPHSSVLVTKSAFTYTRKNVHSGGPRKKNAHLPRADASVCGRKTSLDPFSRWHMMVIWGKQHISTYVTE